MKQVIRRAPEELLAELSKAGTRLLRVESYGPRSLYLLFDRATLQIELADLGLELALGGGAAASDEGERLEEAEPWWALIGAPLSGAWSTLDDDQRRRLLELQLRPDGENPKIVTLEPLRERIRARAIAKSQWEGAN